MRVHRLLFKSCQKINYSSFFTLELYFPRHVSQRFLIYRMESPSMRGSPVVRLINLHMDILPTGWRYEKSPLKTVSCYNWKEAFCWDVTTVNVKLLFCYLIITNLYMIKAHSLVQALGNQCYASAHYQLAYLMTPSSENPFVNLVIIWQIKSNIIFYFFVHVIYSFGIKLWGKNYEHRQRGFHL